METLIDTDRNYWRDVLLAGGGTTIPRWTLDPAPGVAEHETTLVIDGLVTALRQRADELAVPISSVLLAAHAKVLAALSGEREVVTGFVAGELGQPLPCRLSTEPESWRALVLEASRAESALLSHSDFPVDDLRRELGVAGPLFETEFDPIGDGGGLGEGTALRVTMSQPLGRLAIRVQYRTEAVDGAYAARIAGYHVAALRLITADPDAEHS